MKTMIRIFLFSLLFSSCALFKKGPDFRKFPLDKLLDSLSLTGEGRGRLEMDQNNYIFNFESAYLSDIDQWGLSASLPLYGEEVLLYKNIKTAQVKEVQSFETRLLESIPRKWHRSFQETSRSMVRFILAKKLNLVRICSQQTDDIYECRLKNDTFSVEVKADKIIIMKKFGNFSISYSGSNLTESFFDRTSLLLQSYDSQTIPTDEMNLELFWSQFQ